MNAYLHFGSEKIYAPTSQCKPFRAELKAGAGRVRAERWSAREGGGLTLCGESRRAVGSIFSLLTSLSAAQGFWPGGTMPTTSPRVEQRELIFVLTMVMQLMNAAVEYRFLKVVCSSCLHTWLPAKLWHLTFGGPGGKTVDTRWTFGVLLKTLGYNGSN